MLLETRPTSAVTSTVHVFDQPRETDVLCGQDKTFSLHPGNKVFRGVIETRIEAYKNAITKNAKMFITKEIVHIMRTKHGARFMKRTTVAGKWHEITDKVARDKISHALRFAASSHSDGNKKDVTTVKTSKKAKRTQSKKSGHRRTISNDSASSAMPMSTCSGDSSSKNESSDAQDMELLFQNQQRILREISRDMECDEEVERIMNLSSISMEHGNEAIPDTLQSADLDDIISAPVIYSIRSDDIIAVMGEPMKSNIESVEFNRFPLDDSDSLRNEELMETVKSGRVTMNGLSSC